MNDSCLIHATLSFSNGSFTPTHIGEGGEKWTTDFCFRLFCLPYQQIKKFQNDFLTCVRTKHYLKNQLLFKSLLCLVFFFFLEEKTSTEAV